MKRVKKLLKIACCSHSLRQHNNNNIATEKFIYLTLRGLDNDTLGCKTLPVISECDQCNEKIQEKIYKFVSVTELLALYEKRSFSDSISQTQ